MSTPPLEFDLEGKVFRVERLKVKAALTGLKLVGKVLLPAIAEAHSAPEGQLGNAVQKVVESLDCLPELLDLFAARTKIQSPTNSEAWVALPAFLDPTFEGRSDLVVQYLVKCVEGEYGAFLKGDGPLGALLGRAVVAKTAS